MCQDKTYNGWSNYETWRINLEIVDDYVSSLDMCCQQHETYAEPYDFGKALEDYVEEIVIGSNEGLAYDYASAFLSDVNWYEIATSQLSDIPERCENHPLVCDDCGEPLVHPDEIEAELCGECSREQGLWNGHDFDDACDCRACQYVADNEGL